MALPVFLFVVILMEFVSVLRYRFQGHFVFCASLCVSPLDLRDVLDSETRLLSQLPSVRLKPAASLNISKHSTLVQENGKQYAHPTLLSAGGRSVDLRGRCIGSGGTH